jgi:hypothetical protein
VHCIKVQDQLLEEHDPRRDRAVFSILRPWFWPVNRKQKSRMEDIPHMHGDWKGLSRGLVSGGAGGSPARKRAGIAKWR